MMFRRVLGILSLTAALIFGTISFAHAHGYGGGNGNTGYSAPELNPAAFGGSLVLVAGGLLLLAERRRGGNN